jgi:amino acid adenylation domain-containing protein
MTKKTMQQRLEASFANHEHRIAIDTKDLALSYGELNRRANILARHILAGGRQRESIIAIILEDRLQLIVSIIAVLKAGCVFFPVDPGFPDHRIKRLLQSTNTAAIISDSAGAARLNASITGPLSPDIIVIEERGNDHEAEPNIAPAIDHQPQDKIYIYLTSGTTGLPKAVVGKNIGLLHFITWEINQFDIHCGTRVSQLIAPGFDPFLRDLFVPLLAGATLCVPPSPEDLLQPDQLAAWLERRHINFSHCVPSLFRLLHSLPLTESNFRSLTHVLLAGEKIDPRHLVQWDRLFSHRVTLVNQYGPTETTLAKLFHIIQSHDLERERIPIGKAIPGSQVLILDPDLKPCDKLVKGEIYIRTPYRSHGYLNDPELNRRKFIPSPFSQAPDDLLYKTGDVGRVLADGSIDIMGRIDRQVKLRGMRIEPEEIERAILRFRDLLVGEAIVVKQELSEGNDTLCAYITLEGENTGANGDYSQLENDLKLFLSAHVPDYMVPTSIQVLDAVPRKPNGKIDFHSLPLPTQGAATEFVPPADPTEKRLADIWRGILGILEIGTTDNFFRLGGNSLNVMALITKIHKEFDVKLQLGEVFKAPYIQKQAALLRRSAKTGADVIAPVEKKDFYPLSPPQQRMFFLQTMNPADTAYNIPAAVHLEGTLDSGRLKQAMVKLIKRHESLRTYFQLKDGQPMQRIHEEEEADHYEFFMEEAGGEAGQSRRLTAGRLDTPFDLGRPPLLRVGIISQSQQEHILWIHLHHIIADAVSLGVLIGDFMKLYAGATLPQPTIQYKDFVHWQGRHRQGAPFFNQEKYWLQQFATLPPFLNLQTDGPARRTPGGGAARSTIVVPRRQLDQLTVMALKHNVTLFILLHAVFAIFLSKIANQTDIVVGTPVAGRVHADLQPLVGMFVNTVALRTFPRPTATFTDYLTEVKETTLGAFENQEYPLESLVEKIAPQRAEGGNPLFNVMFVLQNADIPALEIPGLTLSHVPVEPSTAKFHLTLSGVRRGHQLPLTLEYDTALFTAAAADRYLGYIEEIIGFITDRHGDIQNIPLQEIEISLALMAPSADTGHIDFGF